ncbi:TPA: DUF551 domain-containing protein [Escherichia coli]
MTDKKQYPGEQYLNELITNIEFAARAPVEVVRAMAAELQKRREADGAEPVAWVMADDLRDNAIVSTPAYPCLDDAKERTIGSLIALYAAPPVPVIQADVAQAIENLKQKLVECNRYNYCADAVKGVEDACRAAILHGSEPVSQASKSQHTQFEQVADLYEMQFDDGRTCAFHTDAQKAAQWLQACDGNRVQEYVKLERLQNALSGNSQVTPDGWISCSERMPEMGERQCYVLAADFKNNYPPNIPNTQVGVYGDWFNDGNPTWDDGDGEDLYLKEVTHWMPLPEPPQEVNRG